MASLIQVRTRVGTFEVDPSDYRVNDDGDGVTTRLRFVPGIEVDASAIALVQIANSIIDGRPLAINDSTVIRHHSIPAGEPGAGFHIDQDPANRNPLFVVDAQPPDSNELADGIPLPFFGEFGSRQPGTDGTATVKPATLFDLTHLVDARPHSQQLFETYALAIAGPQAGTYYGGVSWGWEMDEQSRVQLLPLQRVSADLPSAIFERATAIWNRSQTSTGEDTIALPERVPQEPSEPDDSPLDLSRVSPEQLEALRVLLENLITQESPSPQPAPVPRYCHSSHSSVC